MDNKKTTNNKKTKNSRQEQKPAEPNVPEYQIKKVEGFTFKNYSINSSK